MHRDTNCSALPALTADLLQESGYLVDNLFADLWRQMDMKTLLSRSGFRKRSGTPMDELVYGLLLWVWLKVDSVGIFARESLETFSTAEKDAFYDVMNREDLNWRTLHGQIAGRVAGSGCKILVPAEYPQPLEKDPRSTVSSQRAGCRIEPQCFATRAGTVDHGAIAFRARYSGYRKNIGWKA